MCNGLFYNRYAFHSSRICRHFSEVLLRVQLTIRMVPRVLKMFFYVQVFTIHLKSNESLKLVVVFFDSCILNALSVQRIQSFPFSVFIESSVILCLALRFYRYFCSDPIIVSQQNGQPLVRTHLHIGGICVHVQSGIERRVVSFEEGGDQIALVKPLVHVGWWR